VPSDDRKSAITGEIPMPIQDVYLKMEVHLAEKGRHRCHSGSSPLGVVRG
jgi:hypothetical protein